MSDEQLIVTIGAKDSASTVIKNVKKELNYLDKEYKLAEKGSKDFDKSMDGLQAKLSMLERKYQANSLKLEAYKKQLDTAREGVSKKEEELQKLIKTEGDNSTAIEKTEKQLARYRQQLEEATRNVNLTELEMKNLKNEITDTNSALNNFKVEEYNKRIKEIQKNTEETAEKFKSAGEKLEKIGSGISKISLLSNGAGAALGIMAKSTEDALSGLEGKLGVTEEEADKLRIVAKSIYSNGFGESLEDCVSDLVFLQQNIKATTNMTDEQKQKILEQISTIKTLFGVESDEITRTLNNMLQNGIVDNIQEGLDVITRGFQEGLNSSGDLLDILDEFSPQFKKLGLSGSEPLAYIKAGLDAGAYNANKMADALKELSIRAIDGSDTTKEGFELMGKSADEMSRKFAEGGDTAKEALKETIEGLKSIQDPLEQDLAGVDLFGTMWEDSSKEAILAMSNVTGGLTNIEGATERAGENIQETFDFQFKKSLREVREDLLPLGIEVLELAKENIPTLTDAIKVVTNFLSSMDDSTKRNIAKITLYGTVLGTATNGIGKFTKFIGSAIEFTGKFTPKIEKMKEKFGELDKKTNLLTKSTGLLKQSMSLINPVAAGVTLGIAAIGGVMAAVEANNKLMQKGISYTTDEMSALEKAVAKFNGTNFKSRKELEESGVVYKEFGDNISTEFQEKVNENTKAINDFTLKLKEINFDGIITEEESQAFVSEIDKACTSAIEAIKSRQEEGNNAMKDMFVSDGVLDESEKRVIEFMNKSSETQINEVTNLKEEILSIEQKALEEKRVLTDGEIALIEEKNARIRQIELENLGQSKEEILYATNEFQERIKNIDLEGAKELVAEKAKIRDEEAAKISAGYDTQIQLMKEKLEEATGEDRKALEEQISIAETKKEELLQKNNELYDGYLAILNEKNPIVMENINKFNGEELTAADIKSQELLKIHEAQYENLNSITESGTYMMYNTTDQMMQQITVTVDENTGEILGIYNDYTRSASGYTEEIANKTKEMGKEYTATSLDVQEALNNMEGATVNSANQIVTKNGEVALSLQDVTYNADGTKEGILNLNGTPIKIKTDTNGAITNLSEVDTAVSNIPNSKTVTVYTLIEKIGEGWDKFTSWLGFADGTDYAPPGVAFVSEEGRELIVKNGKAILTGDNGPELFNFTGGEKVYTNEETERILSGLNNGYFNSNTYKSQSLIKNSNITNNYNNSINNSNNIDLINTVKNLATEISKSIIVGLQNANFQLGDIHLNTDPIVKKVSNEFAISQRRVR